MQLRLESFILIASRNCRFEGRSRSSRPALSGSGRVGMVHSLAVRRDSAALGKPLIIQRRKRVRIYIAGKVVHSVYLQQDKYGNAVNYS